MIAFLRHPLVVVTLTIAVLYLDGAEHARLRWDATQLEPEVFRSGKINRVVNAKRVCAALG